MGGRAAQEKGTAHQWDSVEAQAAGSKGGKVVSRDREHVGEIRRRGGLQRGAHFAAQRFAQQIERDMAELDA